MGKAARAPSESYLAVGPLSLDRGERNVVWDWARYASGDPRMNRLVKPSRRTLDQFAELGGARPSRILAFARRWGLLELCRHRLPKTHNGRIVTAPGKVHLRCEQETRHGLRLEPVAEWRHLARVAAAVLRLAAAAHTESPAAAEDLALLAVGEGLADLIQRKRYYGVARVWSEYWLELAQLSPTVWSDGRITFHAGGFDERGGLFGNLALQLALAIVRSDGFGICPSCRVQFTPSRSSQRWCVECRRSGLASKLGMADLRSRRRRNSRNK